jgi:two-component system cell cycle sensor histidine kinase/response regulator CckA
MTHGIIERSGGAITAGSTPGAGTTFEILLPCAGDESGPTRPHVLLVEDDTTVRAVVVRALDRAGYAVTAAEPAEALALLDGPAPVDVLVTDVVMAGIGGVALAEHATTRRPGLPVLFVSGHPRAALAERGVPDDAHVLEKPFGMSRLCSSVEQVLATGSADTTGS